MEDLELKTQKLLKENKNLKSSCESYQYEIMDLKQQL